jgi:HIV Tat-specific factor 1
MSGQTGPKQTAVYITGLPDDVTIDELNQHFSKVGIIMDDMFSGGPRIKLYEDEEGKLKGDALVVYLCEPSVQLAREILDESQLRPGIVVRVLPASFNKQPSDVEAKTDTSERESKQRRVDKETWKKQMQEMKKKIAWDADKEEHVLGNEEEKSAAHKARQNKLAKVVVLRHMFTKAELEEDPAVILDIKEDLLLEAEKFGPVTSVYLFEQSDDGRCAVKFKSGDSAAKCVAIFDGRYFGGQRIKAEIYDGSFRLRETKNRDAEAQAEEERLIKFSEWLEQDSHDEQE